MVPSRGESPLQGDANLMPASIADIGRSLRLAREAADLTLGAAAVRAGLGIDTLAALETGNVGQQHDRIATLRAMRTYADSLGLPGADYVLVAIEQWPSVGPILITGADTAVVPVVSITSAPPGGHAPAGGHGSLWTSGDVTGVADVTSTGVMGRVGSAVVHDTGQLPILDTGRVPLITTGEVPAIGMAAPRMLKVMIGVVAFLVVLGAVALVEHDRIDGWSHSVRTTTTGWVNDTKSALGMTTKPSGHHKTTATTTTATKASGATKVTLQAVPGGLAANFTVSAASFTVKVEAVKGACWVDATTPGTAQPVFAQDLLAGQSHAFVVTQPTTIETGSAAGRAFFYRGNKLIGFYFPAKAPFKMNFIPRSS
jgi:hypothetical protein